MNKQKTILICPLDWGIGHASRCVPVIRCLHQLGHRVVIAADNKPLALLQSVFPNNEFVRFPGYVPTYSKGNSLVFKMITEAPRILKSFSKDKKTVDELIHQYKIDGLISDNRFGASSSKIPSAFITHQLFIQTPKNLTFAKPIVNYLNHGYLKKFNEVWIPDFENEPTLSGKLSHSNHDLGLNIHFIGPLSRFSANDANQFESFEKIYDILVILSGPEPQRTILENLIMNQLKGSSLKAFMIRGLPGEKDLPTAPVNLTLRNHVNQTEFLQIIASSKHLVSRSGYSTIMDFFALNQHATLIPTPGQTEQTYLAEHLSKSGLFNFIAQNKFDLTMIDYSQQKKANNNPKHNDLLIHRMQSWLSAL